MALVASHQIKAFVSPFPGPAPVSANDVRGNDNILRTQFNAHDADSSIHVQSGTLASRPATATAGTLWIGTDTGVVYFYTGAAWVEAWVFRQFGAWQDTTNQTAAAINTGYAITFNTTDVTDGITLVSNSRITVPSTGIYNLQFSAQFVNTDSSIQDIDVWVKKNGTNIAGTDGQVSVPNRHGSVDGHALPAWNYFLSLAANDYVELFWSTTSTTVSLQALPASGPHPAAASVIATIHRV